MEVRDIILTAQHPDCAFFSTVHIHKRKQIKASVNMYMEIKKMYLFQYYIYKFTIYTNSKEDSDGKIKA